MYIVYFSLLLFIIATAGIATVVDIIVYKLISLLILLIIDLLYVYKIKSIISRNDKPES